MLSHFSHANMGLPGVAQRQQRQLISLKNWCSNKPQLVIEAPSSCRSTPRRRSQRINAAAGIEAPETSTATASLQPPLAPALFKPEYYDSRGRLMLKCLTLSELEQWCESLGEPPGRRALQLWRFMYKDNLWLRSLDDAPAVTVQNGFSASFRDKVRAIATLDGGLELLSTNIAADGTRKLVFRLSSGPGAGGQIETVLIPITREGGSKDRVTVCVSSQVGCAMGCKFCWTGKMGLLGNLSPGQIVEQVVVARRQLFEDALAEGSDPHTYITNISNIVYMGMGEPLDALDAVLPSLEILTHHMGMHFSYNKITVSTVGLVPAMRKLADASRVAMAVSLHAASDEVRDAIVPVNKRHSLEELVGCMEELFPKDKASPRHGNHVLIEYTLLSGVNDRVEDAGRLLELLKNVRCKINLIEFNPHEGTQFEASNREAMMQFRDVLIRGGHVATVRESRGDDKMAACGQLGNPDLGRRLAKSG